MATQLLAQAAWVVLIRQWAARAVAPVLLSETRVAVVQR
jgi:hypothetical protein